MTNLPTDAPETEDTAFQGARQERYVVIKTNNPVAMGIILFLVACAVLGCLALILTLSGKLAGL